MQRRSARQANHEQRKPSIEKKPAPSRDPLAPSVIQRSRYNHATKGGNEKGEARTEATEVTEYLAGMPLYFALTLNRQITT
jgi:hypothetical protein